MSKPGQPDYVVATYNHVMNYFIDTGECVLCTVKKGTHEDFCSLKGAPGIKTREED